jgi:hypothetical protein
MARQQGQQKAKICGAPTHSVPIRMKPCRPLSNKNELPKENEKSVEK